MLNAYVIVCEVFRLLERLLQYLLESWRYIGLAQRGCSHDLRQFVDLLLDVRPQRFGFNPKSLQ